MKKQLKYYHLIWILVLSINAGSSNNVKIKIQDLNDQIVFKKGTLLKEVLQQIESKLQIYFTYESEVLEGVRLKEEMVIVDNEIEKDFKQSLLHLNLDISKINSSLYVIKKLQTSEIDKPSSPNQNKQNTPDQQFFPVKGKIMDEEGNALIGVNIYEKNNPVNGVSTDVNGAFEIEINNSNAVLVISYLGYRTEEIDVSDQNFLEITLLPDAQLMEEIVVTEFGIEKSEKLLTSNVQALQSEELSRGRQESFLNALEGKVSGIQLTTTSGAPGAATEIILRGATSVDGNNQPLIVVDGIPISNARESGTMNRASDINPADIASVSVLKGASAAALYGIDAANGAIIIKTKSGSQGKPTVSLSTYYSVSEVANLHEQQDYYSTGFNGSYNNQTFSHWGPKYRKSDVVYDNLNDFFDYGSTFKVDLNVSGGNDNFNYYISGSHLDDVGIVPNTNYDKRSILLKLNSNISNRLTLGTTINAIKVENNYGIVDASGGWLSSVYRWPRWDQMSNFLNPDGSERNIWNPISGDLSTVPDNPWWTAFHKVRNDEMYRVLGNIHLTYSVTDWFELDYRIGQDFYNQHYKSVQEWGSAGSAYEGAISEFDRNSNKWTSTLLAKFDYAFIDRINTNVILGHNIQSDYAERTSVSGTQFKNPDLHSINNLKDFQNTQFTGQRRVVGVFGDIKIDFDRTLILGMTMRNDWSSTLPEINRSFFYPSFSAGLIFSELLGNRSRDILSFGKIRASYAEVGKDAPPHKLTQTLEQYLGIGQGWKNGAFAGNPSLKPEITKELEVGIDLRFLDGRFGVDVTYYNRISDDQIITPRVTPVTGAILQTVNSGSVENKGLEMSLNIRPIDNANLKWNLDLNAFGNRSKLTQLFGDLVEFPVTYGQVSSIAIASSRLGQPLFGIIGTDYQRTANGEVIVDEEGYPIIDNEKKYIGNREPKLWYGVINTFDIGQQFQVSFQVDGALGADILNATGGNLLQNGIHHMLEEYRRKEFIFDGVVETDNGSFVANDKAVVLDRAYFTNNYGLVGKNFVESVDWLRLRNVEFSYFLPASALKFLNISSLVINASAQNLFLLSDYSGGDPQVNNAGPNGGGASGAGTMGVDYYQVPTRKAYSIGLNVKF